MKTIIWIIIIAALGYGVFSYATRPVAQPTTDISESASSETEFPASETAEHYRVTSSDSKIQFAIKETLNEKPFTAVGTTNQIAGDIEIENASTEPFVRIGTIKVDARTFKTDSEKRDGAVNRFILKTETPGNEYVTFTPTSIVQPTAPIVDGKAFTFTVTGDLTISGIKKSATMKVTATKSADKLSATIATTVKRSDYGLKIPEIPFVANVSDSFDVSGTIVAKKI